MNRLVWVTFAAYCLLASSAWLMVSLTELELGVVYGVVGLVALAVQSRRGWDSGARIARLAIWSVLLLGAPAIVMQWAAQHASNSLGTVMLGLVPLGVMLAAAQGDTEGRTAEVRERAAAAAGLGGMLLLISVEVPRSTPEWMGAAILLVSVATISIACVGVHRSLQGFGWVESTAIFCVANALMLVCGGFFIAANQWSWTRDMWAPAGVGACQVVLVVGLLRWMPPVGFSARFLAVPLLTILEGLVLLRPGVTVRMGIGVALLAVGAGSLLRSREDEADSSLSLQ